MFNWYNFLKQMQNTHRLISVLLHFSPVLYSFAPFKFHKYTTNQRIMKVKMQSVAILRIFVGILMQSAGIFFSFVF